MTKLSFKQFLEAVDRNALPPKERKATPANWLEGVMTEFVHAGLHAEFERQDRLKTKYKVTQFSTGGRVANMYLVKSLPGYYCQVNKIEGGAEGSVVWRGNTDTVLSRKPKPGDVEKNAERVFGLLLRALRESKSALPLVEAKTDFNEYSVHLGDGVVAELTDRKIGKNDVLTGSIVDMHGRWPEAQILLRIFSSNGREVYFEMNRSSGRSTSFSREVPEGGTYIDCVIENKQKLLAIAKELARELQRTTTSTRVTTEQVDKVDFNEYPVHLGDGVIAELTDYESTEKEVRLKGNIVDMHGRWPDDEVTLLVYPEKGETTLLVMTVNGEQSISTRRKHGNTVAPALSLVHTHKSKLFSITKELVGIE